MKLIVLFFTGCLFFMTASLQAQTDTLPYHSEQVHYTNADSSIRFGGTLTIPRSRKPVSAVVIISGTGQQDRDGLMGGHKMFAALADYLSRHGIAVLRVDDRGKGETTGIYANATTEDFALDALAGIHFLQRHREIAPKHIGLIGHSEGGSAACILASRSKEVAFIVSLSGLAQKSIDALIKQNHDLVHQAATTDLNKQRFDTINQHMLSTAYQYADSPRLEQHLRTAYAAWRKQDSVFMLTQDPKQGDHFFFPIESYIRQATSPWYRYFIRFDPATVISKITIPVLAINGDHDIIAAYKENIDAFTRNLEQAHNRHYETWIVPGLNHLYQHCITCTPQEYTKLEETFAPEVLERMANWVNRLR